MEFNMKYFKDNDTLTFIESKCIGCTLCTDVCPHGVFEMRGKKAYLVKEKSCMECGACEKNCPAGAIKVKSGVGCAAAIITGLLRGTEPTCDCSSSSGKCC
jgi:NAD-dependent dihydropyrimidine dehydrogenase PreA subunit